jgi:hypothetical protein
MTLGEFLTGNYRVRALRSSLNDAGWLCNKMAENIEIRRHALKLRYWPQRNPQDDSGQLLDLDWSWIQSMPGKRVGELRIHDTIAGNDNLRIIFFVGDEMFREPLPIIWILRVMQKDRNDFSRHDIAVFKARRTLVIERFYKVR